jgi:MerR family transcriptional regulator, heat shock protein HspR
MSMRPTGGDRRRATGAPGAAQERRTGSDRRGARVQGAIARVQVAADRGVFMISVAAELANMHPQTLRMYEARGLIEPRRSPKGTRLYSQRDVDRLRRIQEMTAELGLNLAGVERVLDLEREIEQMNARIEQLELDALDAEVKLAEQLEQLRRSFRAELAVPYRGGELVRMADIRHSWRRRSPGDDGA